MNQPTPDHHPHIQWTGHNWPHVQRFIHQHWTLAWGTPYTGDPATGTLHVRDHLYQTWNTAPPGHWIIRLNPGRLITSHTTPKPRSDWARSRP